MKKSKIVLTGVILSSVALLATGCGGSKKDSKLVCTATTSGVDIELDVAFKGDVIDDMNLKYNMDLSKYSDTQIKAIESQDFCDIVKSSMKDYEKAFTNCKQKVDNKQLKITADFDIDKIANNITDKMTSPEDGKKALESEGYKCTIK